MAPAPVKVNFKVKHKSANAGKGDSLKLATETTPVPIEIKANGIKKNLIAQEIKFGKLLAGNDSRLRSQNLKKLKKWLTIRSNSSYPFADEDFMRIWKGLFYSMWMSDKPLVQEKLADDIGDLIHVFDDISVGIRFFNVFLERMSREWIGIDQFRIDKFMMLVRRCIRQMFVRLRKIDWLTEKTDSFTDNLADVLLSKETSIGLLMHLADIFLDELAKVSGGDVNESVVTHLLKPFMLSIATQKDGKLSKHVKTRIFYSLLMQSAAGRKYQEKFDAWKSMGFPGKCIDDLEEVSDIEVDDDTTKEVDILKESSPKEKPLDPRAGRVDVEIPIIPFNAQQICDEIEDILYKPFTNVKSRRVLRHLIEYFKTYDSGCFPFGRGKFNFSNEKLSRPMVAKKVKELIAFETKLNERSTGLKLIGKRKRKHLIKTLDTVKLRELSRSKKIAQRRAFVVELKRKMKWVEEDIAPTKRSGKKKKNKTKETKLKPSIDEVLPYPNKSTFTIADEWSKPLEDGEVEYFVPSMKKKVKEANSSQTLVVNPVAIASAKKQKKLSPIATDKNGPGTPKKVQIMLKLNRSQDTNEYIRQIRNSPSVPFDSTKQPVKGSLKPNLMASPINPFYKKHFALQFNETI